ncbi:hypothetical protein Esti_001044 [Eimeria stiedai]
MKSQTGLRYQQQRLLLQLVLLLLQLSEGLDVEAALLFAVSKGPSWGPSKFRCHEGPLSKLTLACPLPWGAPAAATTHGAPRPAHKSLHGVVPPEQQQQQEQQEQQQQRPFHTPVMLEESVSLLLGEQPDEFSRGAPGRGVVGPPEGPLERPRLFVDCTAGGGGHAAALAQRLSNEDVLICCDIDGEAIAAASKRLCPYLHQLPWRPSSGGVSNSWGPPTSLERGAPHRGPQVRFVQGSFRFLRELVFAATGKEGDAIVDGYLYTPLLLLLLLLLLGLLLQRLLRQLGEEPLAKRIARAIVTWQQQLQQQQQQQQVMIEDLVALVVGCAPQASRKTTQKILSKIFQALRIYVNEEVVALQQLLLQSLSLLRPGSRLVLLSFHSIEDSIVASAFARHKLKPATAAAATETAAAAAAAAATARAAAPLIEDGFRLGRSMVGKALEASQRGAAWKPLFKQQQQQQQRIRSPASQLQPPLTSNQLPRRLPTIPGQEAHACE